MIRVLTTKVDLFINLDGDLTTRLRAELWKRLHSLVGILAHMNLQR